MSRSANQAIPKTRDVRTLHSGKISKGKITFFTRPELFAMRLVLLLTLSENTLNTAIPQNMISGKAARLSPKWSHPSGP